MQPKYQPRPSISCNIIDRRTDSPARGLHVHLRCTNLDGRIFKGTTNENGYILWWETEGDSRMNLLQYIFDHQGLDQMCWHMQFNTSEYFHPMVPQYNFADVNFVIHRGEQAPNVFVYADTIGFGTWIQAFTSIHPTPVAVIMQNEPQTISQPSKIPEAVETQNEQQNLLQSINNPLSQPRHRFSPTQHIALQDHFIDEPYPNKVSLQRLSDGLNLHPSQTRGWFVRNRSRAAKKQRIRGKPREIREKIREIRPQRLTGAVVMELASSNGCESIPEEQMEQGSENSDQLKDIPMDCESLISIPSIEFILENDSQSTPDHSSW